MRAAASVPLEVLTSTVPVVAPVGTVVAISDSETTVKVAAVPLNVALVTPVRLLPRILTAAPTCCLVNMQLGAVVKLGLASKPECPRSHGLAIISKRIVGDHTVGNTNLARTRARRPALGYPRPLKCV